MRDNMRVIGKGACDPCANDWKLKIKDLWENYQEVIKKVRFNGTDYTPDGQGKVTINYSPDLSDYVTDEELQTAIQYFVTESELTTALADKQDILVSGTNIKTINGNSVLGSGNLVIEGGGGGGSPNMRVRTNKSILRAGFDLLMDTGEVATIAATHPDVEGTPAWTIDGVSAGSGETLTVTPAMMKWNERIAITNLGAYQNNTPQYWTNNSYTPIQPPVENVTGGDLMYYGMHWRCECADEGSSQPFYTWGGQSAYGFIFAQDRVPFNKVNWISQVNTVPSGFSGNYTNYIEHRTPTEAIADLTTYLDDIVIINLTKNPTLLAFLETLGLDTNEKKRKYLDEIFEGNWISSGNVIMKGKEQAVVAAAIGDYSDTTVINCIIDNPRKLSQLMDDYYHITVSRSDIDRWNNKQDQLIAGTGIKIENNVISLDVPSTRQVSLNFKSDSYSVTGATLQLLDADNNQIVEYVLTSLNPSTYQTKTIDLEDGTYHWTYTGSNGPSPINFTVSENATSFNFTIAS